MDHLEEVATTAPSLAFKLPVNANGECGIANLIEAAEVFRRTKVVTDQSFSETFFSAAKKYLG